MAHTYFPGIGAVVLCAALASAAAQSDERLVEDVIERTAFDTGGEQQAREYIDALERAEASPLQLNTAREAEILALPCLSEQQARAVVHLRRRLGEFARWEQLEILAGLDRETLAALRRCVWLHPGDEAAPAFAGWDARLRTRLEHDEQEKAGFTRGAWTGPPRRSSIRVTAQSPHTFGGGALIARDPGELSWADHAAWYLRAEPDGDIEDIVLGCFRIGAGTGLVLGSPGRGTSALDTRGAATSAALALSPSLPGGGAPPETGLAARLRSGSMQMLVFAARAPLDGRVDSLDGSLAGTYETGLHRSASEQATRASAERWRAGCAAELDFENEALRMSLGAALVGTRFSRFVAASSPWDYRGRSTAAGSVYARAEGRRWWAAAECAANAGGGAACAAGAEYAVDRALRAGVGIRACSPRFQSLYGSIAGTGASARNEYGWRFGLAAPIFPALEFALGVDASRRPVPTATVDLPVSASELRVETRWRISSRARLELRWTRRSGDDTHAGVDAQGRELRALVPRCHESGRVELRFEDAEGSGLRLRCDAVSARWTLPRAAESGYLLAADAALAPADWLRLRGRVCLHETESYDTRLYMAESTLPGAVSSAALYGRGARCVLSAQLRWSWGACALAWSQSLRPGAVAIGSGDDAIAGDETGRLSMQLDLRP